MAEDIVKDIQRQVRGRRSFNPQLVASLKPSPQLIAKHRRRIEAELFAAFERGVELGKRDIDAATKAPVKPSLEK